MARVLRLDADGQHRGRKKSQRRQWRNVFQTVIDYYQEVAASAGVAKLRSLEITNRRPLGVAQPCRADFAADVWLSAKSCLSTRELIFFALLYVGDQGYGEQLTVIKRNPTFQKFLRGIQERCGKCFLSRGLWPVSKYFQPRDFRPVQRGCRVKLAPLPPKTAPALPAQCAVTAARDVAEPCVSVTAPMEVAPVIEAPPVEAAANMVAAS